MPSTRDPVAVVQPGPGRLPANTVPANALIFPPGGGSSAALTAHITDPVGAHAATAISTTAGPAWLDGNPNAAITAQARIDEIIADLIANQGSNRTGQPGFAGNTWNVAAGALSTALTELFESANARPAWVLDANPAAKGDFVGPNALISAVAAGFYLTERPTLFLRPGTYNWTDPSATALDAVTIIGGNNVTIQNLAGNMRCGILTRISNVQIQLSGNLVFGGAGFCELRNVNLLVGGEVQVNPSSVLNSFEHVYGNSPQFFKVEAPRTMIRDYSNCQVRLLPTATDCVVGTGSVVAAGLKYNNLPALSVESARNSIQSVALSGNLIAGMLANWVEISGDSNTVSQLSLLNVPAAAGGNNAIWVSGHNNTLDAVSLSTMSGYIFPLFQVGGGVSTASGNVVTNLKLDAVSGALDDIIRLDGTSNSIDGIEIATVTTPAANQHALLVVGTSNKATQVRCTAFTSFNGALVKMSGVNGVVEGVTASSMTTPAANFSAVDISGEGCTVRDVRVQGLTSLPSTSTLFNVGSLCEDCRLENVLISSSITPSGKYLVLAGEANVVKDFKVSSLDIMQVGFELIAMYGVNCQLSGVQIDSFSNNAGATAAFMTLNGQNMMVEGVFFSGLGTAASLTLPLVRLTANSSGTLRNVRADGGTSVLRTAEFLTIAPAVTVGQWSIEDCYADMTDNSSNAITMVGASAFFMAIKDSTFRARGDGAVGSSATVFMQDMGFVEFRNVYIEATEGHATAFPNCAVTLDKVAISGGNGAPNAGRQLFHGSGYAVTNMAGTTTSLPLVLRDVVFSVGTSNVNTLSLGDPTLFFGGQGSAALSNHGPIEATGLQVMSGGLSNWNRSSIVAVDLASVAAGTAPSAFQNVTINLGNLSWVASGTHTGASTGNITAYAFPNQTITGLTGMTASMVGRYLTVSGAATAGNNGQFLINSFTNATTVVVTNNSGSGSDANDGALAWSVAGSPFPDSAPAFLGSAAAVLDVEGPNDAGDPNPAYTAFRGVSILNVINGAIADERNIVRLKGCAIDGLLVEGPSVATGAGTFTMPVVNAVASSVQHLDMYPTTQSLRLGPSTAHVQGGLTYFRDGLFRNPRFGNVPWAYLRGYFAVFDNFNILIESSVDVGGAVVDLFGYSKFNNGTLSNASSLIPYGVSLGGFGGNECLNNRLTSTVTVSTYWPVLVAGAGSTGRNRVSGNFLDNTGSPTGQYTDTGWSGIVVLDSDDNVITDNRIHMLDNADPLAGHIAVIGGNLNVVNSNVIHNERFLSDSDGSITPPFFSPNVIFSITGQFPNNGLVGKTITITGAATAANNGTFPITSRATSQVVYTNAAAVVPDANNGSITWALNDGFARIKFTAGGVDARYCAATGNTLRASNRGQAGAEIVIDEDDCTATGNVLLNGSTASGAVLWTDFNGTSADILAPSITGFLCELSGASGFTSEDVGATVYIENSIGNNNGTHLIMAVLDSTTVQLYNGNAGVFSADTNMSWVRTKGSGTNVTR